MNEEQSIGIANLALLDDDFLVALTEQREKDVYARIIALDINELPIDQIEGRVTGGSVSVDGDSTVRRTCNLTMVANQIEINDYYWGIKTKFLLEVGLKNNLTNEKYLPGPNSIYPDIVWFKQGIFIVTNFNTSLTTNNCTISLTGKDKMCLLNGDLGGQLFASIDFGTEETKELVMLPVNVVESSSEAILEGHKYYKTISTTSGIEQINETDTNYAFTKVKKVNTSGDNQIAYFKKEKNSYLISGSDQEDARQIYIGYKLINHPSELFEPTTEYKKDITYKRINGSYYLIAKSEEDKEEGESFYALTQLYEASYEYSIVKIPLERIIRESVHAYAQEPYHNIIINDLDEYGLEQLTFKGDAPLYALRNVLDDNASYQLVMATQIQELLEKINQYEQFQYDNKMEEGQGQRGTPIYYGKVSKEWTLDKPEAEDFYEYTISKYEQGDDIGYRITDLTYTGDLVSSIGDTLTSVLDKIKTMLGNFEYFYDENGKFIFQRKHTYVDTAWSQLTSTSSDAEDSYVDYVHSARKKFAFNFEGNRLITAIQNQPNFTNLRNDYVVWGKRKGLDGVDVPIHARYAIDKKPLAYYALNGRIFMSNENYSTNPAKNLASLIRAFGKSVSSESTDAAQLSAEAGERLKTRIKEFATQLSTHELPSYLAAPQLKSDDEILTSEPFTPGWWSVEDWAEFYEILTGTKPHGTMKFYSRNDASGRQSCTEIEPLKTRTNSDVWLIQVSKTGFINIGHGSGKYDTANFRTCSYYRTLVDENDNYINEPVAGARSVSVARDRSIQLELVSLEDTESAIMYPPYSGCADTHTYDYFKLYDELTETKTYFYNPGIPDIEVSGGINGAIQKAITRLVLDTSDIDGANVFYVDWRELIYQMALDYFAGQGCSEKEPIYNLYTGEDVLTSPDNFLAKVGELNKAYYPSGYTGYEQYYTDMQGFWRQLYDPFYEPSLVYDVGKYINQIDSSSGSRYFTKKRVWQDGEVIDCNFDYYIKNNPIDIMAINATDEVKQNIQKKINKYTTTDIQRLYWNTQVFENPERLNFWFDFLDGGSELQQFSIAVVGDRTKVVNEDRAQAIVYASIPNVILYNKEDYSDLDNDKIIDEITKQRNLESAYTFISIPSGYAQFFNISYRSLSVKNKIDELLYNHSYCVENISLTTLPVYFLQPNTRIFVYDKNVGIEGEYIVQKFTIPLTYNGTMSITAVKAPERLY